MPSTAQRPPGGSISPRTTLSIILIIAIPSVLLAAICYARRTPFLASIPGNRYNAVHELTRPSRLSKQAKLQSMPVVRYNKKLSAALKQDLEAGGLKGHHSDSDASTSTEDLAVTTSPIAPSPVAQPQKRSFLATFTWLPLPASWKEPKRRFPGLEFLSQPYSTGTVPWARFRLDRRQAVQCCAICTEDFRLRTWVRRLPCAHIFHPRCIDPWLVEFATTCPLCRIDLKVKQEADAIVEPPRVARGAEDERRS